MPSVVCEMTGRGTVPPVTLIVLPFDVAPLRGTICFLGPIGAMEDAF